MDERFSRTAALIGADACVKLKNAKVLVFGAGGVGSYAIEALARAGIGAIDIVDGDTVSVTNINRQIIALTSTVGIPKADAAKARVQDINPDAKVTAFNVFYANENADIFEFSDYDYVVDAIDMVSSKLLIIEKCASVGTPVISSMGTGNKFDPNRFRVTDIYKTSGCPLARVMRRELKKRGIEKLEVVFSDEEAKKPLVDIEGEPGRNPPGSLSFVPPVAGLIIAGHVIKKIAEING